MSEERQRLIDGLLQTGGPDMYLNAGVHMWVMRGKPYRPARIGERMPEYTASLDEIMDVIEEEGWWYRLHSTGEGQHAASVWKRLADMPERPMCLGRTPAGALCAAYIKAQP